MDSVATRLVRTLVFLAAIGTASAAIAADQVVGNCSNDSELRSDLTAMQSSGGTLTFSCGTATIPILAVLPEISTHVTIDGGGSITISGTNSTRIFFVAASGGLELEDIVLTNGSSAGDGGAIFNFGTLELRNVEVKNSVSALSGGAIVTYGPLTISGSTFSGNRADGGGALYARFAPGVITLQDSVLRDNETTEKLIGWGGAVLLWDGASITLDGALVEDNQAAQGGAINNLFANSSITIRNSRFERNRAGFDGFPTDTADGGAIYSAGTLAIETTAFLDNDAQSQGGAVLATASTATIEDSLVRGGTASQGAGVHCNDNCLLTMRRSTLYENAAGFGGAAAVVDSTATFENVTFGANDASGSGGVLYGVTSQVTFSNATLHENSAASGVIYLAGSSGTTASLRNTIVSGSTGSNCVVANGSVVSLDGNLSDDESCASYLTSLHDLNGAEHDPLLLLSSIPAESGLVYVPQPGSPAVDAGVSGGAPSTDQRGVTRPRGIANDIGSVEVGVCDEVLCGDATGDGNIAATDALFALRTAVGTGICPAWICDFNGDGSIAASDALAILRAAVGQTTTPDCPVAWDCLAE
jgi:hypothetical protein